jgi:hypothetical protein
VLVPGQSTKMTRTDRGEEPVGAACAQGTPNPMLPANAAIATAITLAARRRNLRLISAPDRPAS